jgi:hypothetical protein
MRTSADAVIFALPRCHAPAQGNGLRRPAGVELGATPHDSLVAGAPVPPGWSL